MKHIGLILTVLSENVLKELTRKLFDDICHDQVLPNQSDINKPNNGIFN